MYSPRHGYQPFLLIPQIFQWEALCNPDECTTFYQAAWVSVELPLLRSYRTEEGWMRILDENETDSTPNFLSLDHAD